MIDITQYNTIIFDFGGVIFDIYPELSENAFKDIGGNEGMQKINDSDILWQFERGEITFDTLHKKMCGFLGKKLSRTEFVNNWNALFTEYKPERIQKIQALAKTHKLIMLSNTNEIHYSYFSGKLQNDFALSFNNLFSKVYLSYEMGLLKPDLAIYKQVIQEQSLIPEKTLFIEDTLPNAEAAQKLGIKTLLIPRNDDFYDYLK